MRSMMFDDVIIAKQKCIEDYERKQLIMSDNKCKQCEYYYRCRFIIMEMDAIINGE